MLASVQARMIAPWKTMNDSFLHGADVHALKISSHELVIIYFLSREMTFLKAFSQAYILMTLIPEMISFIIRTRLSVSLADLNLMQDHPRGVIWHLP